MSGTRWGALTEVSSEVQRVDPRAKPLETGKASHAVMALVFASMASQAVALYLGGTARIASHLNQPALGTHATSQAVRISALCAVGVGIWALAQRGTFARAPYVGSIVLLVVLIFGAEEFLWSGVPSSVVNPTLTGTAVLLTFPAAWRMATDRQILLAMSPLVGLCALSVATYVLRHEYFFPWYSRWGLIAVLIAAAAVALNELPTWVRLALASVSVLSVMMSTSRQALLGILLLAAVWLLRAKGLGSKLRGFAGAVIAVGLTYGSIAASQRVEGAGGITSTNGRSGLYHSAWSVLSQSPLFGLAGDKPSSDLTSSLTSVGLGWSTSVHNFILDVWLRGGLLAVPAAVVFVIVVVWPRRPRGRLLGIVLLPFLMLGSSLLYFEDTSAALIIALAYGIGMSGQGVGPTSEMRPSG
jgi:O-antigen ligase